MKTKVLVIGLIWLALAVWLGAGGVIARLHPPAPQLLLLGLTAGLLLAFWRHAAFRSWLLQLPPRGLVLLHTTRLVAGAAFLVFHARGELPFAFAVTAGWGDIAVAVTALMVSCISADAIAGRRAYQFWNAFGLADILFVVATAARLALVDPDSMSALLRLPLSLLPTFLVPIIIASHIVLFVRLGQTAWQPGARRAEVR